MLMGYEAGVKPLFSLIKAGNKYNHQPSVIAKPYDEVEKGRNFFLLCILVRSCTYIRQIHPTGSSVDCYGNKKVQTIEYSICRTFCRCMDAGMERHARAGEAPVYGDSLDSHLRGHDPY